MWTIFTNTTRVVHIRECCVDVSLSLQGLSPDADVDPHLLRYGLAKDETRPSFPRHLVDGTRGRCKSWSTVDTGLKTADSPPAERSFVRKAAHASHRCVLPATSY